MYGRPRVGEVTDAGLRKVGSGVEFGGLLIGLGLVGAALIKRLTKLQVGR